jgi:hypothetical protein
MALVGAVLVWHVPTRGAWPESGKSPRSLIQFVGGVSRSPGEDRRYFETQRALLRSRLVILPALERREVRELPALKRNADAVSWLQQNLQAVQLQDSELLQVSLAADCGASADDQAAIVNAVVNAYMDQVANVHSKDREARLKNLIELRQRYVEMLKERRSTLSKLLESSGVDTALASDDRKELSRLFRELRAQRVGLRLERAEAETLLARRKQATSESVRKEIGLLEERVDVVRAKEAVLDDELSRLKLETRASVTQKLDLDTLRDEISRMKETSRKIAAEAESLAGEREGAARARIIEQATPPKR